jgi:hypothetical protein
MPSAHPPTHAAGHEAGACPVGGGAHFEEPEDDALPDDDEDDVDEAETAPSFPASWWLEPDEEALLLLESSESGDVYPLRSHEHATSVSAIATARRPTFIRTGPARSG